MLCLFIEPTQELPHVRESGIQQFLLLELWNPEDWNPESTMVWNPEYTMVWIPESRTFTDSLTWGDKNYTYFIFQNVPSEGKTLAELTAC